MQCREFVADLAVVFIFNGNVLKIDCKSSMNDDDIDFL